MPADVAVGGTPKHFRWDQTPVASNGMADIAMVPNITNAPGFMQENKHNHYLIDKELDAILPLTGYAVVTPPPSYTPILAR